MTTRYGSLPKRLGTPWPGKDLDQYSQRATTYAWTEVYVWGLLLRQIQRRVVIEEVERLEFEAVPERRHHRPVF